MATSSPSPSAGAEQQLFSQLGIAEIYEQALVGPLFAPWVPSLLDAVQLAPGDRVLDVACGTGIVARVAQERLGPSGKVVGVDLNPHMLTVARRVAPGIEWRQGDAGALPLAAGEQFDVVLCQQGCQFFPDLLAAARQMHAALVPGGRAGVSTWRSDEEMPVLRGLRAIAERHLGPVDDRRHGLPEPGPLEDALRAAGFRDVRSTRSTRTLRFADGNVFARLNAMALLAMSARARELDEPGRQQLGAAIAQDSAGIVRRNTDANGFSYELGANVVLARA